MPFTISSLRIISHSQWARAVSLWAGSLVVYVGGESQSPPLKFTITTALTRRSSSSPARNRSSLALPLREVLRANGGGPPLSPTAEETVLRLLGEGQDI